jgi:hypothetical protein
MKKKLFLLTIGIIAITNIIGQNLTQTVRGTVVDKDTKTPLEGVTIILLNSTPLVGTSTDASGEFFLRNVPLGRQNFQISYVGYKKCTLSSVEVNSGKEVVLDVNIEEAVTTLEEVAVRSYKNKTEGLNEMSSISSRVFSVEETGRYAGSRNDVSRMATNYAGVSNGDDSRNDIIIRGNSPNGLLWRLEDMEIPSPNHFTVIGSSGGPVSMLNYNVIANSDFMSGAFPAEYGNATSGVFDIKLRNGNNNKHEYMAQAGALGTELMLEGPFSKNYKGSYLLNYRFSTTSILRALNIDFGYAGKADYQDLAFNINLPLNGKNILSLFGLGGHSIYKLLYEDKSENDFGPDGADTNNSYFISGTGAAGISLRQRIGNDTYVKTIVGFSGTDENGKEDSINIQNNESTPVFRSLNYQYKFTIHSYLKAKLNAKNKFKAGVILDRNEYQLNTKNYNNQLMALQPLRMGNGNAWLMQVYGQWNYIFTDNLSVVGGLHYQYFGLNQNNILEPRASIKWNFIPGQSLTIGYGLHSQLQLLPVYLIATNTPSGVANTNKKLKFNKSNQFVIGYNCMLAQNTALKAEAYYQRLFDYPVNGSPSSFSMVNEGMSYILTDEDSLVNNGKGRNIGIELTVEKFFNKGFYYLFTTSLFDSKYKGSDGIERNTAFNGKYVFNILAGKEFKTGKKAKIIFDIKITTAGGKRYTPIDENASKLAGQAILIKNQAYSKQFKNYFRTDFKVTYRFNGFGKTQEFFLNLDNVFNTKNVFTQIYSTRTNKLEYVYQLGLFPTFQYKIFF